MNISSTRGILLVGVALLLIGVIIWFIRRRLKKSSATGNEETGEQREQAHREQRDREIPLRRRAMRTPFEAKVVGVLAIVIMLVTIWEVYNYMKTGSPSQVAAAGETKFLAGCVVAFAIGIWYDRRRKSNTEGYIDVTYEAMPAEGEEEKVVRYYYDPRDVKHTDKGPVMYEREEKRKFGLFRMPKLHGDDRRFRDVEDPRPPSDKIGLEIPTHARKVAENHWAFRSKDRIILDSADGQGDIQWLPPYNKSLEQDMQRNTDIDNLQTRVKELRARNAELERGQRARAEEQRNEMDEVLDQMETVAGRLKDMMPGAQRSVTITEENQTSSHTERGQNGQGDGEQMSIPGGQNGQGRGEH